MEDIPHWVNKQQATALNVILKHLLTMGKILISHAP